MAFHPPSPSRCSAGLAEDKEVVEFGVARELAIGAFHLVEDILQAHNVGGLAVTHFTHAGAEQREGELALGGSHILYGEPFAVLRDEMPVLAFVTFKLKGGFAFLVAVKGRQEFVGSVGHFVTGNMGGEIPTGEIQDCGKQQGSRKAQVDHVPRIIEIWQERQWQNCSGLDSLKGGP
jgi:hypothetical protein